MQAIRTRYLGPTDTKGGRIKAECERGSITVGYAHDEKCPHGEAVRALLQRFADEDRSKYGTGKSGWSGVWVGGGLPKNQGMAWVQAGSGSEIRCDGRVAVVMND